MSNFDLHRAFWRMLRFVHNPSASTEDVTAIMADVSSHFQPSGSDSFGDQLVDVVGDTGLICMDLINSLVVERTCISISNIAQLLTFPCQILSAGLISLGHNGIASDRQVQFLISISRAMQWVSDWALRHDSIEDLRSVLVNNGAMLVTNLLRNLQVEQWIDRVHQLPPLFVQRLMLLFCRQPTPLSASSHLICNAFVTGCRRICEDAIRSNASMELVSILMCPCMVHLCKTLTRRNSGVMMHSPVRMLGYASFYSTNTIHSLDDSETRLPVHSDRKLMLDLARLTKRSDLPVGVRFWSVLDLALDVLRSWPSPSTTCTVTEIEECKYTVLKHSRGNFTSDMQSVLISVLQILTMHGKQALDLQMKWTRQYHSNLHHSPETELEHHLGGLKFLGYVGQQNLEFPSRKPNLFDLLLLTSSFMEAGLHKQASNHNVTNQLHNCLLPGLVVASEALLRNICEEHDVLSLRCAHTILFFLTAFVTDANLDACMSLLATAHKLVDSDKGSNLTDVQTQAFCLRLLSHVMFETVGDLQTPRWKKFLLLLCSVLTSSCAGYQLSDLGPDMMFILRKLPEDVSEVVMPLMHCAVIPSKLMQGLVWSRIDFNMGLLPGCCNWMCENVGGCAESLLPTWRCRRCSLHYCSRKCQKQAWLNGHCSVCIK